MVIRSRHLELEQLEDRTVPSTGLPGPQLIAQPTYQLLHTPLDTELAPLTNPMGLDPAQVRNAYGIDKIVFPGNIAGDGTGERIAIVDAYDDPSAAADLTTFDAQFGLNDPSFVKVGINAQGHASTTTFPSPNQDWSVEIALDVEWAHAVAPNAGILLVEANSNSYADLLTAIDYARNSSGVAAVSMSWGGAESASEAAYESHFTTPVGHGGVTFFASAGDAGAPALFPAVSDHVVSVGGTSLTTDSSGNWLQEDGWSGSGGGVSSYVSVPGYQDKLAIYGGSAGGMRVAPDVAYNADPATGVAVLATYGGGGWLQVGGTSAGSPQWAALTAIADQGRALAGKTALDGYTQTLPDLYSLPAGDFHDITTGNNGFAAGPGFDLVTGLGSPVANFIVPDLVGIPQVLTSVTIGPGDATAGDGSQLQLSATALDQFGKAMVSQPSFTWSLVSGTGAVDANGVYTAPVSGTGADIVEVFVDGTNLSSTLDVNYAPSLEVTAISADPSTVTGTTTTLSAAAVSPGGGYLSYFWWDLSAPVGAVGPLFSDEGVATTTAAFFQAGAYTLEVIVINPAGQVTTATVGVTVVSTLTSVEVSPGYAVVAYGAQQQFTATGLDQFQQPIASTFTWSLTGPGTLDANGLYTAPLSGPAWPTVQATTLVNGVAVSGTAYMTLMQPPTINSVSAVPDPGAENTATLSVSASDALADSFFYSWAVVAEPSGAPLPIVSDANADVTSATFYRSGTYTFQVAVMNPEGQVSSATVSTMINPVLTSILVVPAKATVPDGGQQQLTAFAFDQFQQLLAPAVGWSVTAGTGAVNAAGLYTAPASGTGSTTVRAIAALNGVTVSGTAALTYSQPPTITSIGASASTVTGTTAALKVTAVNASGGSLSYSWSVLTQPTFARVPTFSAAHAAATTVTFFQAGTYTFQVAATNQRGLTTSAQVTVTVNPTFTYVKLSPTSATVHRGSQEQFSAVAQDQFHNAMAIQSITWSASGPGSISGNGMYQAPTSTKGTAVITVRVTVNGVTRTSMASVSVTLRSGSTSFSSRISPPLDHPPRSAAP